MTGRIRGTTSPPTVLVADDNDDVRSLVRFSLEGRGWAVVEAANGAHALAACRRAVPDLVLLDISMPVLDGWDVLAGLQTDSRLCHVPVIMLTGRDGATDVVQGFERGAHDYLKKPFSLLELAARAEAALRIKRLNEDLRRRNQELDEASRTDALTGLRSRRHTREYLWEAATAARRHRLPLAVVMVDIDHFKQVNDTLGHAAGDGVLGEVAGRLQSVLRAEDVAGRWGGDELIVILPFTDGAAAHAVAERIRAVVRATPIALDRRKQRVTISAGCAAGIAAPDVLLQAADQALYRAKQAGRDTVRS